MPSLKISEMDLLDPATEDTLVAAIDAADSTKNYKVKLLQSPVSDQPDGFTYADDGSLVVDPGITSDGDGGMDLTGALTAGSVNTASLAITPNISNQLLSGSTSGVVVPVVGVTHNQTGSLFVAEKMTSKTIESSGGLFSSDLDGNVIAKNIAASGPITSPSAVITDLETMPVSSNKLAFISALGMIKPNANVDVSNDGAITTPEEIEAGSLAIAGIGTVVDPDGYATFEEVHAVNGFSGSGVYTTFTIVDGIITAAS